MADSTGEADRADIAAAVPAATQQADEEADVNRTLAASESPGATDVVVKREVGEVEEVGEVGKADEAEADAAAEEADSAVSAAAPVPAAPALAPATAPALAPKRSSVLSHHELVELGGKEWLLLYDKVNVTQGTIQSISNHLRAALHVPCVKTLAGKDVPAMLPVFRSSSSAKSGEDDIYIVIAPSIKAKESETIISFDNIVTSQHGEMCVITHALLHCQSAAARSRLAMVLGEGAQQVSSFKGFITICALPSNDGQLRIAIKVSVLCSPSSIPYPPPSPSTSSPSLCGPTLLIWTCLSGPPCISGPRCPLFPSTHLVPAYPLNPTPWHVAF